MIKLSIMVCSLPERIEQLGRLFKVLEPQLGTEAELYVFTDNRTNSTGMKRHRLAQITHGRYHTYIDDDDSVAPDFVSSIIQAIDENQFTPVITYDSIATLNGGNPFRCIAKLENDNEQVHKVNGIWQDVKRSAWHWCAWRVDISKSCDFPDTCVDDDWYWLKQAIPLARADDRPAVYIPKALHFYQYNSNASAANRGHSSTDGTL